MVAPTRITPRTEMVMLTHCRRVGCSLVRMGMSSRVMRGMQAMMVPLSLELMRVRPKVSPRKYKMGWKRETKRRGQRLFPFSWILNMPSAAQRDMAAKAMMKRQLNRLKTGAWETATLVAKKLKPNRPEAASAQTTPSAWPVWLFSMVCFIPLCLPLLNIPTEGIITQMAPAPKALVEDTRMQSFGDE